MWQYMKKASCEEGESSHVEGGRPNKRVGLSIYTRTQNTQLLGLTSQNRKGGFERTCQVYSRQRRYQNKLHMGYPSSITAIETGMVSLHTQHLEDMAQYGTAFNTNNDSTTESVERKWWKQ